LTIELTLAQQSDLHLRYRAEGRFELVSDSPAFTRSLLRASEYSLIILKTLN
jgi:hypothetical protein